MTSRRERKFELPTRRALALLLATLWLWPMSLYAQSADLMEADRQGQALYEAGLYEEAIPLWRKALELAEREFGPDHLTTAILLAKLALLYEAQGRYEPAEPLYRRALDINRDALAASHPRVATSLINLARLYDALGRHNEAEPLYRRGLAIREKVVGPDHPDFAKNFKIVVELYEAQDRYEEIRRYITAFR